MMIGRDGVIVVTMLHVILLFLTIDPDNCLTCEKILNRYYVKYLESLPKKGKYPNHEKYVSFTVGHENSDS